MDPDEEGLPGAWGIIGGGWTIESSPLVGAEEESRHGEMVRGGLRRVVEEDVRLPGELERNLHLETGSDFFDGHGGLRSGLGQKQE